MLFQMRHAFSIGAPSSSINREWQMGDHSILTSPIHFLSPSLTTLGFRTKACSFKTSLILNNSSKVLRGLKKDGQVHYVVQKGSDSGLDRKSTRLNSSHSGESRMPSSA